MERFYDLPQTLYKYRSWENQFHRKLLTDAEIFLSSPTGLNDPFDAALPFRYNPEEMTPVNIACKLFEVGRELNPDITEAELHQQAFALQSSGRFEDGGYWKEALEGTKARMNETFGILSMTTKRDNLLMWAHYSDCHRGFCVGIDRDLLYETIRGTIGRVTYQEEFPFMPLFHKGDEQVKTLIQMLNTKSPHWQYEDEVRLTKHGGSNRVYTLPTEAITEVIIGCNMKLEDQQELIKVVDSKLPHATILSSKPSLDRFELEIYETMLVGNIEVA